MYANKPEMAKRWEADTPKGPLPPKVDYKGVAKQYNKKKKK